MLDTGLQHRFIAYLAQEEKKRVGDHIAHTILVGFLVLMTVGYVVLLATRSFASKAGIVPLGLVFGFWRLNNYNRNRAAAKARLERSLPVWATVLVANEAAYESGSAKDHCGALVLVTFDKTLTDDTVRMTELVQKVWYLKQNPCDQVDVQQAVDWLLTKRPMTREGQRYLIPPALLEGAAVYAVELYIHRKYLKEGKLAQFCQRLPCLIEPDNGAIWHLPHHIVERPKDYWE